VPCLWLYLASRNSPERFCDKPGHPYCPDHQRETDAMARVDRDWEEILASFKPLCVEPGEAEGPLCAACGSRPVHDDCVYCDQCCEDR
jgi:hypothetical protein